MKVTIVFTEDFATYKKGEETTIDSMIASSLIRQDKVAKLKGDSKKESTKEVAKPKAKTTKKK